MFVHQLLRRLASGCRRIAGFIMDIVYLLLALCIEIADRFESED